MTRDDLSGSVRAPRHVTRFLARIGGKNIYGEPNWRLVWAGSRMEWRGGEICTWPDETDLASCGGLNYDDEGGVRVSTYAPIRREVGLFKVPKFPEQAQWLLEMWWPAHKYGSRDDWALKTRDPKTGIPMLGPYPEQGDYEVQASFTSDLPGIDGLESLIQKHNWELLQKHGSLEKRIQQRLEEAAEQQRQKEERETQAAIDRIHDRLTPLWSSSLEAARVRGEWAKRAGIKSHVGA